MTLEDFERDLAETQSEQQRSHRKREREHSRSRNRSRSPSQRKHRHHHHHKSSKHHRRHSTDVDGEEPSRDNNGNEEHSRHKRRHEHKHGHRDKRAKREREVEAKENALKTDRREELKEHSERSGSDSDSDEWVEKEAAVTAPPQEEGLDQLIADATSEPIQRDSWMQAPSALDVDYVNSRRKRSPPPQHIKATDQDYKLKLHKNELNHQLKEGSNGEMEDTNQELAAMEAQHEVSYTFGDSGSSWRMMKLKNLYRQAKESGKPIEQLAMGQYGDLRTFDDAREEELELERRKMYGKGYVGKEKPSGELFQERKLDLGIRRESSRPDEDEESEDEFEMAQGQGKPMEEKSPPAKTVPLDQTALNKLKAQMMKAKLRRDPEAAKLEAEYNEAMAALANKKQPDVVVLNKMENRMLTGERKGEVKHIQNKRGRERGLVEENEDMSIDDMVRQEKRSRGQFNEGQNFAERIAKDSKFDDDLDYLDENASKLARAAPKSDINLRNTAIESYQKTARILANCPLCHHEDTDTPPLAPIVSLATRVYLTLPTSPEITPYGLCASIVPIQHHRNLLDCDEDEWEEIRNFMKALTRFYFSQKPSLSVIFYENAAHEGMKRHASLEAVPLPLNLGETAPAFFREAIMASDEEWTQHKKLIDTLAKAEDGSLGKLAFRRSMVSELPYFHVWFKLDGGYGHVVEDPRRWPKGDLFAREVLGGMLDVPADIIKRQGRWRKGDSDMEKRIKSFKKKGWEKWDWTSALMDPQ